MAGYQGRRTAAAPARRSPQRGKKAPAMTAGEKRRLAQLLLSGGFFVLLVAVKLLFPAKMAQWSDGISAAMERNMDVAAVFSSVGRAFRGESDVGDSLQEVIQEVFHPGESPAVAVLGSQGREGQDGGESFRESLLTGDLYHWMGQEDVSAAETVGEAVPAAFYAQEDLPEGVRMEQAVLGFAYASPLPEAAVSSEFGYREHPVQGEERFHYGVDLAAESGTPVACFADGSVTAVGESSSYGKYLIVAHEGGYATLYAHCSAVTVSSGSAVKRGQEIAKVGETGMATGPHLHFELHEGSSYLNPIYYVASAG